MKPFVFRGSYDRLLVCRELTDSRVLHFMKILFTTIFIFALAASFFAQKADEILATATGLNFTSASLSAEARKLSDNQKTVIADTRTNILSQMLTDILLETEAKAKNISVYALVEAETRKIPNPTDAEIKAVFEANSAALADKSPAEARSQIIEFLRRQPEQKATQDFIEGLKIKYKFTVGKDVNAPDIKPFESLFTITGKSVSAQEFESKSTSALYDVRAEIADQIRFDLENSIFSALVNEEAKTRNIDASSVIAAEITDKMREFSDTERAGLESAFKKTLFTKFNVKILLKEIEPFVQNISADDDPAQGKSSAPVTVIMFSDFQCSACSVTHPVLKKILAEYGDRVRFVVRDFPLTNIHENALQAAFAANAANAQGKFFEYTDVLYRNQTALDATSLKKYATDLGLNVKQFEIDLSSEKTAAEVRKDVADGTSYGISGTPTIFVNGVKVRQLSADGFRAAIEKALTQITH